LEYVGGEEMAKVIKKFIIAFFIGFFTNWLEDFLILIGVGILVANTYFISIIDTNILAGNYFLGTVLIGMGIILAKR
jgi:hypothetical protein